jgi:hypothetical protein
VSGDRVLPRGRFRHPAVSAARRRVITSASDADLDHPAETQGAQRGHGQGHRPRDVPERVAAAIAIAISVRQLADTNAVEDDEDDPAGLVG